jgi:hypothetical protein
VAALGRFSWPPSPKHGHTSNFTAMSFEAQTWQGTVKVVGGTGLYKGIKSKKAGTMTCLSPDSVHLSCTQKLKLKPL